jgi:branched-chain amino acid transport system ATP-binding protein
MMVRVSGEIRFAGERIDGRATEDIVRGGVAHVPDGSGTFLDLTVEENLRIGAYTQRDKGMEADFGRLYDYFPRLKERRRQQAGTLSGGEQQMLAISRALMFGMLLVEQNADIALELADHAYLIETGCIVMGGPAAIIACNDAVRRAYLGY